MDGHNVREYRKNELAKKIGYVSQKAVMFSGDIRSNVNFGDNDADDATVEKSIEIAQSSSFVEEQKGGIAVSYTHLDVYKRQGLGIACVIKEFVTTDLSKNHLIEIPLGFPIHKREIGFAYPKNIKAATALQLFVDFYKNFPPK